MTAALRLRNTFTKTLNAVELNGKLVRPGSEKLTYGSFYICGPTVYSDCHIGHAFTYIRADLFRRFMKSIFNVKLITVMNITDIDDKILDRTREQYKDIGKFPTDSAKHPFNQISERYYKSFLNDIESIRVLPADLYVRVSKSVHLITRFIQQLEEKGYAYRATSGDIHFKVTSLKNYQGRSDPRKESPEDQSKLDPRDFVLWKKAKAGEPTWLYQSKCDNEPLYGRPGWHVQCSAISSALFGNQLDFHFGGKDLIFPHHYNEEACCCAFHELDSSKSIHVWSRNWLHSGHLVLKSTKMSKSLGNVIAINDFISNHSVNAIRLLCILTHYRSDVEFDEDLLDRVRAIDHKIKAFVSFLVERLKEAADYLPAKEVDTPLLDGYFEDALNRTRQVIVEGVCDDLDLGRGLEAILNLAKLVYSRDGSLISATNIIACLSLLRDWCNTCGLDYTQLNKASSSEAILLETLSNFRQKIRLLTLEELKKREKSERTNNSPLHQLLKECDKVRSDINDYGFVPRDSKS